MVQPADHMSIPKSYGMPKTNEYIETLQKIILGEQNKIEIRAVKDSTSTADMNLLISGAL